MEEEKFVAKLKSNVSRSYNNMENNYMNMNLLKGEKAFLMADVRIQTKGKWKKERVVWLLIIIIKFGL